MKQKHPAPAAKNTLQRLCMKAMRCVNPAHCFKVDTKGDVSPTWIFWNILVLCLICLLLVAFKVLTGSAAAAALVITIGFGISIFQSAATATEFSALTQQRNSCKSRAYLTTNLF